MFLYLSLYGKDRFKTIYFFTVKYSSVYYYYYWPAALSVHIDILKQCSVHSKTTY
jgi:hypothetical protein